MNVSPQVIEDGKQITLNLSAMRVRIEDALRQHEAIAAHPQLPEAERVQQALCFNDTVVTPLYNRMERLQHERMAFYARTQHLPACGYLL